MTNILALPRKHSSSWNNRPRDRKTLQDIAGSHPAANNESQKQEKTCIPLHPATPSSHKVLPPFSPQSIMQMGEHPHKRVQDRAKPAAQTSGHTRTPLPAFTNARSTDVAAFEHSLSPILLARLPLHLTSWAGLHPPALHSRLLGSDLPHHPLPQADAPSSIRHRRSHAHAPLPTPPLALVYHTAHPESATHETLLE